MMESSRISRWSEDHAHKSSLEAAAEAAAKVNAMLIAKGKLKPSQLSQQQGNKPRSQAQQGGLIVAEVEINDVPIGCRNMLTRGATQEEISKLSGAAVSTRGRYLSPEEKVRNVGDRPLYLCVQGPNQEIVDVAVGRINEIILNGMKSKGSRFNPQVRPPLPPVSMSIQRPPLNQPPPLMSLNTQPTGLAFVQEKLYIGLEHAPPTFDVKNKMLGPMGSYLNHIQTETGAKVTLRGKGSGFLEPTSGREAFEPMHVHLQHPTVMGLQQAKQLAENLIQTVQQEYAQFQQALVAMPPTLSPGTAQILAGLQQTAPALLNTQGIATLSAVSQPGLAALQPQPGGLPSFSTIGGFPGLNPPQFTSVVMPTSTALTTMPPTFTLAPGSTPGIVVPTSLAPSGLPGSLAQVHVPTSLPVPISAASLLNPGNTLAGAPPQQVIVHTQGPPQLQTITQVGPPQLVQQPGSNHSSNSPVPQSMMTTVQPELQVVSQPALLPAWGAPAVQQAPLLPPPQIIQMPNSSGPPVSMVNNSCPLIMTTSTSGGYSYPLLPKEETKRRFTEEKQEEKVPENLLGYEHGPPHLTNLVVQGPPPGQNHSPSSLGQAPSQQQFHITQPPTITEGLPPPAVAPSISHSPPGQHNAPIYTVHTSLSEEGRVTHTYTVQASNNAGPGLQQPPLGLIEGRQGEPPDEDKKLMPPPPIPVGMKRPPSGDGGIDRKKMKEYGGEEEEEELQSSLRQQHKDVKKYQYNQYSNSPQLYGQQQAGAGDHAQIQPGQFGQGSPIPSGPPQTFESQQPIPQQGQGHFAGQGQILYQQQQQQAQQGQPPPMEQFAQGPPLSVSPGLQQQQLLIQQQLPQQPGPPPPLHLQSPPPMSSQPISVNQNYQQPVYAASPQPSQSPPPPWNTEPVPSHSSASASPTPQFTSVTQPITMNSPQRLNPPEQRISQDDQPRLIAEQIPPPPPNFQNIPPPGSTPQLMTQPPPPPPPQHLLPFNTQPPQFAGQPPPPPPGQPGYQPTGPPVGLPYW